MLLSTKNDGSVHFRNLEDVGLKLHTGLVIHFYRQANDLSSTFSTKILKWCSMQLVLKIYSCQNNMALSMTLDHVEDNPWAEVRYNQKHLHPPFCMPLLPSAPPLPPFPEPPIEGFILLNPPPP